ncbi:hypothetical protein H5410_010604, partial [Solanum commersonii]
MSIMVMKLWEIESAISSGVYGSPRLLLSCFAVRWWKNTGLAEKLSFSRDILVENMFWAVGALFEPQHSYFRRLITKVTVFISVIDDIYGVYGTLDELELFTLAIQRWDTKAMEQLPDYMKVCYLALINIINEVAYEWADLCKSYLQEAKWYYNGYKPNLEEYMDNARISIAVPMILVHSLFLVTNRITKEALDSLTNFPDIIRWSVTIFRLNDGLGTSSDELKRGDVSKSIQCYMNEKSASEEEAKRTHYIFDKGDMGIHELNSEEKFSIYKNIAFHDEKFMRRHNELKMEVKIMLSDRNMKQLEQLEIIDNLQRLGLSYHFDDEICSILNNICDKNSKRDNLYAKALEFRLLRQHGFYISQEIFYGFYDNTASFSNEDTKGMLYLYEASLLAIEGEKELELARNLTEKHLREYLADQNKNDMDQNLVELVHHALELPLHWRMLRLETKWFINYYKKRQDKMIPFLLELATLDFNIVQEAHIKDLKYVARWWKETCLAENLPFARDRLVENFFWTIGVNFLPQYGYFRRIATKVNALVTTIDDVYDVFGTLDELQIFTHAIQRWNIKELDKLPDNMKMCYYALDNFINQVAADAFEEQGIFILPYLRNAWRDLCKSYLREAKWYHSQYIPSMEEYIDNAWISISAPVILVHAYFLVANPVNKDALHYLENNYHEIIRCSALILRLANDLGTSSDELKRGDVPKSIQCYMNETQASEEEARQYIRVLISQTWKKLNEAHGLAAHPFPKIFVTCAMNLARMAQCMYQHGDGHGGNNSTTKNHIMALLFESVPLGCKHSSAEKEDDS